MFLALVPFSPPAAISPTDPRITYVGRFDRSDPTSVACEWSASEVRMRVHGSKVVATIDDSNGCGWEQIVDGKDMGVLALKKGEDQYSIDLGQTGDHELELVRRTEAFENPTRFKGFEVPDGKLLKSHPKARHIEVVGDSITCGYGNEGKNHDEHFKPETENAYASYASVAAREVNADVTIIAWSGRKMWPDNTTPELYDLILPTQKTPVYDFKGPAPDAVVINLATNDFGRAAPAEAGWTAAYETFCARVWSHYPKAQIYATTGSMMYGENLAKVKLYLSFIESDLKDRRFHRLDFEVQKESDGYGSDWHPSLKTDQIMGDRLAEALKHDLHW